MTALKFIEKILRDMEKFPSRESFMLMLKCQADEVNNDYFPKWINTDYCKVTTDACILGITVDDDDPAEVYIDSLTKLKNFFLENNVKFNSHIFINTDADDKFQVRSVSVIYDSKADAYVIDCK